MITAISPATIGNHTNFAVSAGDSVPFSLAGQGKSLESALGRIFPTQQEDTQIQKARRIMGDAVKSLSDHELEVFLTEFQYLIEGWLDTYERSIFNGLTLQQLLGKEQR